MDFAPLMPDLIAAGQPLIAMLRSESEVTYDELRKARLGETNNDRARVIRKIQRIIRVEDNILVEIINPKIRRAEGRAGHEPFSKKVERIIGYAQIDNKPLQAEPETIQPTIGLRKANTMPTIARKFPQDRLDPKRGSTMPAVFPDDLAHHLFESHKVWGGEM